MEAPSSGSGNSFTVDFSGLADLFTTTNLIIVVVALLIVSSLFRKRRRRRSGWYDDGADIEIDLDFGSDSDGGGD